MTRLVLALLSFVGWMPLLSSSDKAAAVVEKKGPPVDPKLPPCNYMADEKGNVPKYHEDVCDRSYHNSNEKRALRASRYNELLQTGVDHIPDEQTAYCPETVDEWELSEYGHDTKLLVENEASTPVVVCYVVNGVEYSAINSEITPPHHDPQAVLQPGQWASIDAFEGHLFYVREILKDGNLGNILMQHRPGLVPIKNTYGHKLPCEKPKLPSSRHLEQLPPKKQEQIVKQALEKVDPEPKVTVPPKKKEDKKVETKRDPKWDRSHSHYQERCNIIYKGFRNALDGCPVHMFYIGMQEPTDGPMQCREEFKFHLGLHPSPEDYMHSWESRTKFEGTFVGHSWVARLASDMNIVVDSYTVEPLRVRDCPDLKKQVKVRSGAEVNAFGEIKALAANLTNVGAGLNETSQQATQANVHSI